MKNSEELTDPEEIKPVPKTHLEIADVNMEAELFYGFVKNKQGMRWADLLKRCCPELVENLNGIADKKEALEICRKYAEDQHHTNEDKLSASKELFQIEWEKIGTDFLSTLAEHFETDWPSDRPEIVANVSVLPVFPRFLDKYSYCVGYNDINRMIETSAHEIVHFLWFKKWKEVFPEHKRCEYESPHLVWRLSEIIDPIILQCHPKIKDLIKPKGWGYPSFKEIKIGDLSMTDYFKKIYLDSVSAGNSFDTTMKLLWEEAREHEKEISVF